MHRPRASRHFLIAALLLAGSLVTACGDSGDDEDSGATPDDTVVESADESVSEEATSDDAIPDDSSGTGTGTLTMDDGTVFELEMSTCDTSENSDSFAIDDGYDLFGATADGEFRASFNRAGFDEEDIREISTLEGEFDENGNNAELVYQDVEGTMALSVDGGKVSGNLTMQPVGPNNPYGDETEATVDIDC
jgi:hypothetical protein